MQILDGKKLAEKIFDQLKTEVAALGDIRLAVVKIGSHSATDQFVRIKKKRAEEIGIKVKIYDDFAEDISTNALRERMKEIVHAEENTGVIVQSPLPKHIDEQAIFNTVIPEKDVDMLSARAVGDFAVGKSKIKPPVVGAIAALAREYGINLTDKYVVVVGAGALVGRPVVSWLMQEKVTFSQVVKTTAHPERFFKEADVIISGVGKPSIIRGDMVKEDVIVFDAGTSTAAGVTLGDVDFNTVAPKASHITTVPGGIGPLTVAVLLRNLVTFAKLQKQ
ncbi:MAG: bifunctional 5,10-methylenetetrahydrofolate dehydrogenase/5,10-methenyltetrahydrofolate cyclohydrolase [Candidatus Sungbacteria bacterium]|nr:bifunctional 5,10-methylenetetrahydrofolate dehydrogenase/5,10-methenyltetrahydrofolate cyclohydrolase [Candidatus Sungbacteria bacterium]